MKSKIIKHEITPRLPYTRRSVTKQIVVHCTATREGRDFTVEDINRWHKNRHWNCIGYHFVVYRDGTVHEGRPIWAVGSHVRGFNNTSVGVCYVGGMTADGSTIKDTRTHAQKEALRVLLQDIKTLYPDAQILGHRDLAAKHCPCFDAYNEYKDIRA